MAVTKTPTLVLLSDFVKSKKKSFFFLNWAVFWSTRLCRCRGEFLKRTMQQSWCWLWETPLIDSSVITISSEAENLTGFFHLWRHNLDIWACSYFGKANEGRLEYWIFLFQGRGVSLLRRVPLHPKWQYWHWLSGRLKNMWKYVYRFFQPLQRSIYHYHLVRYQENCWFPD